jgi:hypothetical protein
MPTQVPALGMISIRNTSDGAGPGVMDVSKIEVEYD